MLRIPVALHSLSVEKNFRLAAWNAFGMEKEGANYRACQYFGAVYR